MIVLDTCALLWWSLDPEKLSEDARRACKQMEKDRNGLVPSISIWEIALKVSRKKLDIGVDLDEYVIALKQSSVVRIVPIDERIWVESVRLTWAHRDPADRVVVTVASMNKAAIITADKEIRGFCPDAIW